MSIELKMAVLCGVLGLLIQSEASAGVVTASIFPGATAQVAWQVVNDPLPLGNLSVSDSDGDGIVQFVIPQADADIPGLMVALCWPGSFSNTSNDRIWRESFTAPLSVFQPFRFVGFSAQDSSIRLVSQIVVEQLIADGGADLLFDPAEGVSIANGFISDGRTSAITFRDGSNLSADPLIRILELLDPMTINNLPLFTGGAIVDSIGIDSMTSIDTFVPEPSTLSLLGIAILGLIGYGRPRRRTRNP
jgi:hypothetical protein